MKSCPGSTLKYLLFLTNFLVFVAGCVMMGFGIYVLADKNNIFQKLAAEELSANASVPKELIESAAIVLIVAAAIIIVVAFLGCCGAIKENRCLIFLYFSCMLVLFFMTTVGIVMVGTGLVDDMETPLVKSLMRYNSSSEDPDIKEITKGWDDAQITFDCCGVHNYTDYQLLDPSTLPTGDRVPESCCTGTGNEADCRARPHNMAYSDRLNGCLSKLKDSIEKNQSQIEVTTGVVLVAMFANLLLLFAFGLMLAPKQDEYQQV